MIEHITNARSLLFVPGHRKDRFAKAVADAVILDLEDAVGPQRKDEARENVRAWLEAGNTAVVRINAAGTPWYEDDVAMAAVRASALLVPKAEEPAQLAELAGHLPFGTGIIPLIETAAGVARAATICAVPAVLRPAFGSIDLALQLGVDHRVHAALHHARSALVLAAATARCASPIDGVTTAFNDDAELAADLEQAATLGFTGKLCIHPRQVDAANRRFTPSADEVDWAQSVLTATTDGSVTVHDGQMIDQPVFLRASAILARARARSPRAGMTETYPGR